MNHKRAQQSELGWLNQNARAFAEHAEKNPWILELRAVLAEADRTGDRKLIDDFARRFKADEARRRRGGLPTVPH